MILKPHSKLLFIGDSITDCSRSQPDGDGLFDELGQGYVSYVNALIQSTYPDLVIRVVNKGVNGNTVRELQERWQLDVVDEKPDSVVIFIGINDVWRHFHSPYKTETHVSIEEYSHALETFVGNTYPHVDNVILMTPFFLEKNQEDPMRREMDCYRNVVKKIANRHGCILVDTQIPFDDHMKSVYTSALAWDRVHPNPTGHMILARAFLNEIGFQW
ncbi:SGNH/GDSL hydrolase family protein [Alteribacter aurantiacus]|uniref:SGNH/GDSL hydrolase family protein n=1 Tax=Alteribacter aurantiacus TaxID=254410 RepID=UPI0003FB416A|nr:SGNH/GDSL hydrolase family protein [Alteribacter aurantiacus]